MSKIESNILMTVEVKDRQDYDDEQFDLVQYRVQGQTDWSYGLVGTIILPTETGVDVDELDEDTALIVMGKLFNIHITDENGVCRS